MEHTKGKWEAREYMAPKGSWRIADKNGATITVMDRGSKAEAHARRIVQCVNSHDGLLEACKAVVDGYDQAGYMQITHETWNKLQKAIAEAD